jgi:hypothetical protein
MTYNIYHPSMHTLRRLADVAGPFPIKSRHMILAAERFGFSARVGSFLELFELEEIFLSRDDFMRRCKDIKRSDHNEEHTQSMVSDRENISTSI